MCDGSPLGCKRVVNTNVIKNKQTFLYQFHQFHRQSIIILMLYVFIHSLRQFIKV